MIDLPQKALKRRAGELAKAAGEVTNENSRALLLFYAAECGLKAIYMARNVLRTTSSSHSARAATYFVHRLDELIVELKIPASTIAPRPASCVFAGKAVPVGELNQVWRYGGTLEDQPAVLKWLEILVAYVKKELS
ncbi:hypothetical protein [Rhizobium sp. G21]|uniref:hypothetical protein n=1 Tax=Rhizobium sp. G21 TaxID=2758439 RepID=UPI00160078E9|nr:hypothetical protein [Rhizobium sp. G21]MBB1248217.1 hypothetical protein [Rhizobium sp. G21]